MTRRQVIPLIGIAATASYASMNLQKPPKLSDGPVGNSAVAIVRARSYSEDLVSRMLEGVRQCGLDARGKRVLLPARSLASTLCCCACGMTSSHMPRMLACWLK